MALIDLSVSSVELQGNTNVVVIYPDHLFNNEKEYNVLFLLHGYSGNNYDWTRHTNLEKLVASKDVIVVMPDGDNSFYTNMKYGFNYYNYIVNELPKLIENIFRVKLTKDNTYIAGLSMGGYGALKAAFSNPDKYKAVGSFSGTADIKKVYDRLLGRTKVLDGIFGSRENLYENIKTHDLFELTSNLKNKELGIYLSCGTNDFLYEDNINFKNHLTAQKISHTFYEEEGSDHNWDFWMSQINVLLNNFFDK